MAEKAKENPLKGGDYSEKSLLLEVLAKQVRQNFYVLKNLLTREGVFDDLGHWGSVILGVLCRGESCSVPVLQNQLPLSRQYVQKEVAKLQGLGLIETIANPAHKSSKLLRATVAGRSEYERRQGLYMEVYAHLEGEFSKDELQSAVQLLAKLEAVANDY